MRNLLFQSRNKESVVTRLLWMSLDYAVCLVGMCLLYAVLYFAWWHKLPRWN